MNRQPIDLSDAVLRLVDLYQPAMAERQHELISHIDDNIIVEGDVTFINRAVSNLMENELVHLRTPSKIAISLHSRDGSAELVVEDNGPGFPPDIAARAFERFVKGKHSPGHGLGLAFVDAVVQSHGGRIRVADRPQGGAVITVSLPLSVSQPEYAKEVQS